MIFIDLILGVLYLLLSLFVGIYYANRKIEDKQLRLNFKLSFFFKLLSAIIYGCVFQFYYHYGDTINYYLASKEFLNYVIAKPSALVDFLFLNQHILETKYPDFLTYTQQLPGYYIDSNIMVHRFAFYLGPITLFQYFPLCVLSGVLSFVGCWKISTVFSKLYPAYKNYFLLAFLFLPSTVFWTAGISKEAICISFINIGAACLIEAVLFKNKIIQNTIFSLFMIYIVFVIKSYIVLSFLPFFLFFLLSSLIKRIEKRSKRFLLTSTAIVSIAGISSIVFILFKDDIMTKLIEETLGGALNFSKGQLDISDSNDSKYDLGISLNDMESRNIVPYIFPSLAVTFFRPYLWEVHKPIILLSFLESGGFLLFSIYLLIKGYVIRLINIIVKNEFVIFALLYSIFLGLIVGIISSNFGTLVRYKTPFISYFLAALLIINHELNSKKKERKIKRETSNQ